MLDLIRRLRPPSVHLLADQLETELYEARPTSRMLDAFKREGRCDGKRGRDSEPTRRFLTDTADLAMSRVVQDYLAEDHELAQRAGRADRALEAARVDHSAAEASPPETKSRGPAAPEAPGAAPRGRLDTAMGALADRRSEEERRAWRTRVDEAARAIETATEERDAALAARDGMEHGYLERARAVQEAAHMMWDRYLAGFEKGSGGVRRSEHGHEPALDLDLELPRVFQALTGSEVRHGTA